MLTALGVAVRRQHPDRGALRPRPGDCRRARQSRRRRSRPERRGAAKRADPRRIPAIGARRLGSRARLPAARLHRAVCCAASGTSATSTSGFEPERPIALRIDTGPRDRFRGQSSDAYMSQLISRRPRAMCRALRRRRSPIMFRSTVIRAGAFGQRGSRRIRPWRGDQDRRPGLMETMRTPVIAGREFTDHDDGAGAPVTLINQSLAERLWPGSGSA